MNNPQNPAHRMNASCILLAAGEGSRMGTPKWKLEMPDGESFLRYLTRSYTGCGISTVVVTNSQDARAVQSECLPEVKIAINPSPGKGRLFSLICGIKQIPGDTPCFMQNIDNPFFCTTIVEQMLEKILLFDVVLPEHKGKGGHPVLLSPNALRNISACPPPYPVLREYLASMNTCRIAVDDPAVLLNINTPEAYIQFRATP